MKSSPKLQDYFQSLYEEELSPNELNECENNLFQFLDLLIEIDLEQQQKTSKI